MKGPIVGVPPALIARLVERLRAANPGLNQTDLALLLQGRTSLSSYAQRQSAGSILIHVLSGRQKMGPHRWSSWLREAERAGISVADLERAPTMEGIEETEEITGEPEVVP